MIALFIATALGFVMATQLQLAVTQLNNSNDSFYRQAAVNAAESALEDAVYAITEGSFDSADGWVKRGNRATRTYSGPGLGNGRTTQIEIEVDRYLIDPAATGNQRTRVIATASVIDQSGAVESTKRVSVYLEPRSLFGNAISASGFIDISSRGRVLINSFQPNRDYGDRHRGRLDYSFRDAATVGADQLLATGWGENFEIYGSVGLSRDSYNLGRDGILLSDESPNPEREPIDLSLLSYGFSTAYPDFSDTPQAEEVDPDEDWWRWSREDHVFGDRRDAHYDASTDTYRYHFPGDVFLDRSGSIRIKNDVVIVADDDFWLYGDIVVERDASLTLYIRDDFYVYNGGNIENESEDPSRLLILSSSDDDRNVPVLWFWNDDTDLHAGIYAPRAYTFMDGRGRNTFFGALVTEDLRFYRDYTFHYDENLFSNIIRNNRIMDRHLTYKGVEWEEETLD
ncbi:MAG: DUF7305 domain-containing protein [Opitutales bacterium]